MDVDAEFVHVPQARLDVLEFLCLDGRARASGIEDAPRDDPSADAPELAQVGARLRIGRDDRRGPELSFGRFHEVPGAVGFDHVSVGVNRRQWILPSNVCLSRETRSSNP